MTDRAHGEDKLSGAEIERAIDETYSRLMGKEFHKWLTETERWIRKTWPSVFKEKRDA